MDYLKESADRYIRQNLNKGSKDYKPRYHFSAQVGWINDPNGLVYYDGYFHIFYQYYPYGLEWGPMHWGHARSKNLVDFEYLPVALAPDAPDESGCFSGGAVIDKEKNLLHLLYTRHYERENVIRQTQYHAYSSDGVRFTKTERAAIGEELLPEGFTSCSFRDPNPVVIGDTYYVVVGAQTKERAGAVLVYSSRDMSEFKYEFTIENENFGEMVECPDLFRLNGEMVLTFSVVALKNQDLTNIDGKASLYAVMNVDFEKKAYEFLHIDSLDEGTDFYAPQTLEDGNGRRIMLAWLDMWNNNSFSKNNPRIQRRLYSPARSGTGKRQAFTISHSGSKGYLPQSVYGRGGRRNEQDGVYRSGDERRFSLHVRLRRRLYLFENRKRPFYAGTAAKESYHRRTQRKVPKRYLSRGNFYRQVFFGSIRRQPRRVQRAGVHRMRTL